MADEAIKLIQELGFPIAMSLGLAFALYRMAHDDTIDALAYAVKYSHPPNGAENQSGDWVRRQIDKPKSWVLA